jgi:hypothetical protein
MNISEELDTFIRGENWEKFNLYCRKIKEENNVEKIKTLKILIEQRIDRRFFNRNAYFIVDNIELLKSLIYLEDNKNELEKYKKLLEKNITDLINYRTNDADMEFTIIKAIANLSTAGILDMKTNLQLVRRNEKKIANFISNHNFMLENFAPGRVLSEVKLNNFRDEIFLLEQKYGITKEEKIQFRNNRTLMRSKFGDNRENEFERYLKLKEDLKSAKTLLGRITGSDIANTVAQITQGLVGLYVTVNNNGLIRDITNRLTGVQTQPNVDQSRADRILGCIKTAVFYLHTQARIMDKNILNRVLEDNEYHVERRDNVKNGVKDPIKNRFFAFVNRCSTFLNIGFTRNENYRQTVHTPPELKSSINQHFNRDTICASLAKSIEVHVAANSKLDVLKSIVNGNKYLQVVYTPKIRLLENEMEVVQQRVENIRNSEHKILSASKKIKNINEINGYIDKYHDFNTRIEQMKSMSNQTLEYHAFLKKFQNNGVAIEDVLANEYQLKEKGFTFKRADFCGIFLEKIKFFASNINNMRNDEEYNKFNERICEEFRNDLQTMVEYYRNSKNQSAIENLSKVVNELFDWTEGVGEFNEILSDRLKEVEIIVEQNANVGIKKMSPYYSFLEIYYNELNKDKAERRSYEATKLFRSIFSRKYNPNKEFSEMLKFTDTTTTKININAFIEKAIFVYESYQQMSTSSRFEKFSKRIKEEFENALQILLEQLRSDNVSQIDSVGEIFLMESAEHPLNDPLREKGIEFDKIMEKKEFKKAKSSSYYIFLKKYINDPKELDETFRITISTNEKKQLTANDFGLLVKKIKFFYLKYSEMSKDPHFLKFDSRITNEFSQNLNILIDFVKTSKKDADIESVQSIFTLKQEENPLNSILISSREKFNRMLVENNLTRTSTRSTSSVHQMAVNRKTLEQSFRNLKRKQTKMVFLTERESLVKELRLASYNGVVEKEEVVLVAKDSGFDFKPEEFSVKDSRLLDMERGIRGQLDNISNSLSDYRDALYPKKETGSIVFSILRFIATPVTMFLPNEQKYINSLLNSVNSLLRELPKKMEGLDSLVIKNDIAKINGALGEIMVSVEKHNNPDLNESLKSNIIEINELYELLAQREVFTRENEGKFPSFEEVLRCGIEENVEKYNIDAADVERTKFVRKNIKFPEYQRQCDGEKKELERTKQRAVDRSKSLDAIVF